MRGNAETSQAACLPKARVHLQQDDLRGLVEVGASCGAANRVQRAKTFALRISVLPSPPATQPIARQIVGGNATTDQALNLVARTYLNDDTEVVEFYEPQPGHILISGAGRPRGSATITPRQIQGLTVSEVWATAAPGAALPASLAEAIERQQAGNGVGEIRAVATLSSSQDPPPAPATVDAAPAVAQTAAPATASAPPPGASDGLVERTSAITGGYCTNQFWLDFNTGFGQGHAADYTGVFNWGVHATAQNGIADSGYAVCPIDDGGVFGLSQNGGHTSATWSVPQDTARWATVSKTTHCGTDLLCIGSGGINRCQYNLYNSSGTFHSNCYLNTGASCGRNYAWMSYYDWGFVWCQ